MSQNQSNPKNKSKNPITEIQAEPTPTQLKREELEALSDSELDERWKLVFATETGPEMEREDVIQAIIDNSPTPPSMPAKPKTDNRKTVTVKAQNGKEYEIPANGKGKIAVLQTNIDMMNGSMIEVPNTDNLQFYNKKVWERLNTPNADGKTFFSESKIKTEVLQKA